VNAATLVDVDGMGNASACGRLNVRGPHFVPLHFFVKAIEPKLSNNDAD
jgi:hypothetical protein